MFCTVSGYPARHYFAPFGYKLAKGLGVFIFNIQVMVRTETAKFPFVEEFFLSAGPLARRSCCGCESHG